LQSKGICTIDDGIDVLPSLLSIVEGKKKEHCILKGVKVP